MKQIKLLFKLAIILALVFLFTGGAWAKSAEKKKETAAKKTETAKVNINKATEEELATLDGIGTEKAKNIVSYRKKNGEFKKAEDLMNVPGIGEATFKKNEDRIVLK